jgi:hypothetical protein
MIVAICKRQYVVYSKRFGDFGSAFSAISVPLEQNKTNL